MPRNAGEPSDTFQTFPYREQYKQTICAHATFLVNLTPSRAPLGNSHCLKTISGNSVAPVCFCFGMSFWQVLASIQGSALCLGHRAEQPTCPTGLVQLDSSWFLTCQSQELSMMSQSKTCWTCDWLPAFLSCNNVGVPSRNEYFTEASRELEYIYLVSDLVTSNTSQ